MTTVVCLETRRGNLCGQVLFKVGGDFSGTVEIKCPRCRSITTRTYHDGVADVA